MVENISAVAASDGMHPTFVRGVHCRKISRTDHATKRRWRACLGFVVQGEKQLTVGRTMHRLIVGSYTATPLDLPVLSRFTSASSESPFLGVLIDWQPDLLEETARPLAAELAQIPLERGHAFYVGHSDERMQDALARLTDLFTRPRDATALGPLVIREILYHLMSGPAGPALHQFLRAGSKTNRMQRVIHTLQSALAEEVDVTTLARAAGMSRAGFFKAFREMTAVSPIQYQKRLRLLEARRMMVDEEATAESSAFQVGYKSASQFNRDYSRVFGASPRSDAQRLIRERRTLVHSR